jgi:CheY-like chemotaxis protein
MSDAVKKVLVVDDEEDAREFVRAVLEEEGYEVVEAADGAQCIEVARAEGPDAIILDVQMPGRDGFHTFADMQNDDDLKGIPVIMLTGIGERTGMHFSSSEMGDYFGVEPAGYVEKPVDPALLQKAVATAIGA